MASKSPKKSILRKEPSETYERKKAKFDEVNILETLHPVGKDYGQMPIDEEKTPWVWSVPSDTNEVLDTEMLQIKLRLVANTQTPSFGDDDLSDEEFPETDEERVQRIVFERRRKAHYNEYSAVHLARELIKADLQRIEEMSEDESLIDKPTDVSIRESEVEPEEQYSEVYSSDTTDTVGVSTRPDASPVILVAPKPQEIEDLLDPTHPCYNRIIKQHEVRERQRNKEVLQQQQEEIHKEQQAYQQRHQHWEEERSQQQQQEQQRQ